MAPEIAFDFPPSDGAAPLQQDGTGRAQQGESSRYQSVERDNPANLELPAAQENNARSQIAPKKEQAVGNAERHPLSQQEPHRPLQCRVARQQDADGGIQRENDKTDGQNEPGLHLTQQHRQNTGHAPHGCGVDQIILVSRQIAEQVTPHGVAAVGFGRPPAAG